jgi:hypothetical protein
MANSKWPGIVKTIEQLMKIEQEEKDLGMELVCH